MSCILVLLTVARAERNPEPAIEKVRWPHVLQCREHDALRSGIVSLEPIEQPTHDLALKVILRTAQITGEYGESRKLGEPANVFFRAIDERAHHHETTLVG